MRYDDREQGAARSGAHEQVIRKLQQAGALLAGGSWERARPPALESSEATFHQRRNRYGRMKAEEAKRRRRLEGENKELKPLSAEADLAKAILREMLRHCQRAGKTCLKDAFDLASKHGLTCYPSKPFYRWYRRPAREPAR